MIILSVILEKLVGPPHKEHVQVVAGYLLLRTDRNWWIELTTDGEQMWVEVERR